ncbi:UNVERIFIED_CONTAM: hypothetical protein FKN15_010968 [Acipenser sinensis]
MQLCRWKKSITSTQCDTIDIVVGYFVLSHSCGRGRNRYEALTNELINEELGIAYPIVDGIPNMIPQDARMTRKDEQTRKDNAED